MYSLSARLWLTNAQEYALGTNPFVADTDGHGVNDGLDPHPLDPLHNSGTPGDTTGPTITLIVPSLGTL